MRKLNRMVMQMMTGRYGTDRFTSFLMGFAVSMMFGAIFSRSFTLILIFEILMSLTICYCLYRMFSTNHARRAGENLIYLKYRTKVKCLFERFNHKFSEWWKIINNIDDPDVPYRIFICPKCRQKIRVPKGKGKIAIKCPKCSKEFIKKT
ncbi:MAG: hypothetical protein IJ815_03620 [Lachnospiraceae bacterium]|nr:hypothetical protein [Lachnospiraceae bacterium]MCR5775856.1 hypothetical protein [Lachnospiraceae bacterium]